MKKALRGCKALFVILKTPPFQSFFWLEMRAGERLG